MAKVKSEKMRRKKVELHLKNVLEQDDLLKKVKIIKNSTSIIFIAYNLCDCMMISKERNEDLQMIAEQKKEILTSRQHADDLELAKVIFQILHFKSYKLKFQNDFKLVL